MNTTTPAEPPAPAEPTAPTAPTYLEGQSVETVGQVLRHAIKLIRDDKVNYMCHAVEYAVASYLKRSGPTPLKRSGLMSYDTAYVEDHPLTRGLIQELEHQLGEVFNGHPARALPDVDAEPARAKRARLRELRRLLKRLSPRNKHPKGVHIAFAIARHFQYNGRAIAVIKDLRGAYGMDLLMAKRTYDAALARVDPARYQDIKARRAILARAVAELVT